MTEKISYEIDFRAVGEGDRSGDAIAVRWGTPGNFKILVYDGGTKKSGQELADYIKIHFQTNYVDYVVNSHPDSDHASGLSVILEELTVGELWMHQPWKYSASIRDYFHDQRITDESLARRLQGRMAAAYELEKIAEEKNIPIFEPFQGSKIGDFVVLAPEEEHYVHQLIPRFEKSPDLKEKADAAAATALDSILKALGGIKDKALAWIDEKWDVETLSSEGDTSAENESSIVLLGVIAERGILLTGDAGIEALTAVADFTESRGVSLPEILHFVQVPHHGSRNNVSPEVLDRIIGPKLSATGDAPIKRAYVSASMTSTTHPRRVVMNAFKRRGFKVYSTKGAHIGHWWNITRPDWGPIEELPFYDQVEP